MDKKRKAEKFEYESSKHPHEAPEEDDRKPVAKRIKKEPEDEAQRWAQAEQKEETTPKPWDEKKDYEAIFRKLMFIGEDDEDYYDENDMENRSPEISEKDHRSPTKSQTITKTGKGL